MDWVRREEGVKGSSTARTNGRALTGRTKDLSAGRRLGRGAALGSP